MKYLLAMQLDYSVLQRMTPQEAEDFDGAETDFNAALRGAGAWVSGAGLDAQARTVRFADGTETIGDGPFADGPERLAGFWMIEAADLESAVEWARKAPLRTGAIEVRPLVGAD